MTLAVNIAQSGSNNQTFRNRIINGAMMIDQRNAGASVTVNSGTVQYAVDRFGAYGQATDGVFTVQQSTNAPAGFTNSLIATVTTADASIGSTQEYGLVQSIEGFNVVDLAWGTASAQPVTLSFWARSSVTGTHSGALSNSAFARAYVFSYTISAANTWEYKTITIPGDTSGTWLTTNGIGIRIRWNLGTGSSYLGTAGSWGGFLNGATGSVQLISTLNATFQITGVQLEEGTAASPFEFRQYGTELALCQRYCQVIRSSESSNLYTNIGFGVAQGSNGGVAYRPLGVTMRVTPSVTASGGFVAYNGSSIVSVSGTPTLDAGASPSTCVFIYATSGGLTATGANGLITSNAGTAVLQMTAEL